MKNKIKLAKAVTKITELIHWLGAILLTIGTIFALVSPSLLNEFFEMGVTQSYRAKFSLYGIEVVIRVHPENIDLRIVLLFGLGGIMIFSLVAMVFRNLYLIIKKLETSTPFHKDNIRMLNEIGIFVISIPVIGLIMSTLSRLILGVDAVETSVNMYGVFMGIVVLCLTQFFIYGAKLEKDVDGLL